MVDIAIPSVSSIPVCCMLKLPLCTVCSAAEQQMEQAAPGLVLDEAAKRQVRAGAVAKFFDSDPRGLKLEAACVLSAPLQRFLNHAFAADTATSRCAEASCATPPSVSADPEQSKRLQQDARNKNLAVVSGRQGKQVIIEMTALLLDFAAGSWSQLALSSAQKFAISLSLICSVGDAWHRLVFAYDQPKFQLFNACAGNAYDACLAREVCEPILRSMQTCPDCVDPCFSVPWVRRLHDPRDAVARKAHMALSDIMSAAPVCSARCERKHLLGQDTRTPKRRGRALKIASLSKVTHCKSVSLSARRLRKRVLDDSISDPASRRKLAGGITAFRVGSWRKRSSDGQVKIVKAKSAKVRAMDVFVSESYHDQPEGLPLVEKRRRVTQAWRRLPADRKLVFQGRADAENQRLAGVKNLDFKQFAVSEAAQGMRRGQAITAKRKAIGNTFHSFRDHPIWSAGSDTASFESGLRPSKVLTRETDEEMKQEAERPFGFNERISPGRAATMRPFLVCSQKFGGMCKLDPLCNVCKVATKNMYIALGRNKAMASLPALVQLEVPGAADASEYHFVAKTVGRGDLAVMVAARMQSSQQDGRDIFTVDHTGGMATLSTSFLVFRRLLRRSARRLGQTTSNIESVQLHLIEFERCDGLAGFAAAVKSSSSSRISLTAVSKEPVRPREESKVSLPFGLSFDDKAADGNDKTLESSGESCDETAELRCRDAEDMPGEVSSEGHPLTHITHITHRAIQTDMV